MEEGSIDIARRASLDDLASSSLTVTGGSAAIAQLAGIQGAKRTSALVPLCHPLPIDGVSVDLQVIDALERPFHNYNYFPSHRAVALVGDHLCA